jgi:TRAP-type C4-dicarboxylate transport system permease small subunit
MANILGYIAGSLVIFIVLLVLVEVISRYVFNRPLMVADEFGSYLLVAVSYLAAAYCWKEKGHVRITVLVSRLPPRVSSWLRLITMLLALIVAIGLSQSAYSYLRTSFRLGMASGSWLNFPLQGPHMTLMIGFTFLSLLLVVQVTRAINKFRGGEKLEEESR